MAKDLTGLVDKLIRKKYEFKNVYISKVDNNYFSVPTRSNVNSTNINELLSRYAKEGYKYFGIVLESGLDKHYFIGFDTENKKVKLPELHYEANLDSYKRLIDIFKVNGWGVVISK